MTRRRERWVAVLMSAAALAGLCFLIGCPPPQVREVAVNYQEIAVIQLESRFVPSEINLVKGRPARLHITNAFDRSDLSFEIAALHISAGLRTAELTQITLPPEQMVRLDGEKFTCRETGNTGTFHVVEGVEPASPVPVNGAVELSVVMTDDLAAPHTLVVKRAVPARLYVTKTRGEEEDDTLLIDAWGIRKDIEVGKVTQIEFTPANTGEVTFMGITTPSSRGTIQVVD